MTNDDPTIDAIGDVLADWQTSRDAMHWAPDPDPSVLLGIHPGVHGEVGRQPRGRDWSPTRLACWLLRIHTRGCRGRRDHVRPDGTVRHRWLD